MIRATSTITPDRSGAAWLTINGTRFGPFESKQAALMALIMAELPKPTKKATPAKEKI